MVPLNLTRENIMNLQCEILNSITVDGNKLVLKTLDLKFENGLLVSAEPSDYRLELDLSKPIQLPLRKETDTELGPFDIIDYPKRG